MVRPQNSLERNHKKCYSTDHIDCYSTPQKMLEQKSPQKAWEGRPHHKKWGILEQNNLHMHGGIYLFPLRNFWSTSKPEEELVKLCLRVEYTD